MACRILYNLGFTSVSLSQIKRALYLLTLPSSTTCPCTSLSMTAAAIKKQPEGGGTRFYLAPDLSRPGSASPAADIWALGVTLASAARRTSLLPKAKAAAREANTSQPTSSMNFGDGIRFSNAVPRSPASRNLRPGSPRS
ncbi:hypothetical protein VTK56DRAFT_5290 [Thermocarpiscus australiensis]